MPLGTSIQNLAVKKVLSLYQEVVLLQEAQQVCPEYDAQLTVSHIMLKVKISRGNIHR